MVLPKSTDLRDENNSVYEVTSAGERERWYIVKDLGATLGETGVIRPIRDAIDAFERDPSFTVTRTAHMRFSYRGPHSNYCTNAERHEGHLFRLYITATPPGMMVTATGYGRSDSWLVTVRPAMMPTAEPNTASLSQWRFAGRRERAT